VLAKAVKAGRGNRRELVDKIRDALQEKLEQCKIEATITGREKHLYSIYRKMQEKNLAFSEVFDIYGFRVVVRDQPTCYMALGALHALYKPIPGKFKDYIAIPKANGYQVAAFHPVRPQRHADRDPDPHHRHEPAGRVGRGLALDVQIRRRGAE